MITRHALLLALALSIMTRYAAATDGLKHMRKSKARESSEDIPRADKKRLWQLETVDGDPAISDKTAKKVAAKEAARIAKDTAKAAKVANVPREKAKGKRQTVTRPEGLNYGVEWQAPGHVVGDLEAPTSPLPPPHIMPPATVDALPLFVKFHKTGSGTAANVFRRHCSEGMARPELGGVFPWRGGPICGPLPHEHASINLYRTKGTAGFAHCLFNRTAAQLYTVLRNPVERFFSGAYFWQKEVAKAGLTGVKAKLDGDLAALTPEDIDALADALHWYGRDTDKSKCSGVGKCFSARPGPLLQFTSVLAQVNVNDGDLRDHPSPEVVATACANLERDFVVGVAEAMDSFVVLAALDQGWPLASTCVENFHFNKDRPRGPGMLAQLAPQTLARLEHILAPDVAVYACAVRQHATHVASHGPGVHASALAAFEGEPFRAACAASYRAYKEKLAKRRAKDRAAGRPKFKGEGNWVDAGGLSVSGDSGEDGEEAPFAALGRCVLSKAESILGN